MTRIIAINRHRLATDGKGVTTLVALHGCPLSCRYCLNPQCKDSTGKFPDYTPQQLLDQLKIDNLYFLATSGGVTFGGGEPLLHSNFIAEFRHIAPPEWKLNIETSLNVPHSNLEIIARQTDHFMIDIKDVNSQIYQTYTSCTNALMLSNMQWLVDNGLQNRCKVRLPLIKDYNNRANVSHSRITLAAMGFRHFEEFTYITVKQ